MRYQGRLTTWNDDRGFGFITPNGGGPRVFVHRSDFGPGRRPRGNELVTYELVVDAHKRANGRNVQYVAAVGRSRGLPGWYGLLSVLTFAFYRSDKAAAVRRQWRTSEQTLHGLALLGGWPGALVAQRWLRHKSTKGSFLVTFALAVVGNLAALLWLQHAPPGVLRALLD